MTLSRRQIEYLTSAAIPPVDSVPGSVDFNGVDSVITKTGAFSTNFVNSTELTISCWIYLKSIIGTSDSIIDLSGAGADVRLQFKYVSAFSRWGIYAWNSASSVILFVQLDVNAIPLDTWVNVIMSCDLLDAGKRHIYVNDTALSPIWTTYNTAEAIALDEVANSDIGNNEALTMPFRGRIAHVFVDQTYRDLSIESNRRIFNQISLTEGFVSQVVATVAAQLPVLYMPINDPAALLINAGTGGNFDSEGGNFARSQRGPNQFNGKLCTTNDQQDMRVLAVTGLTTNKTATFSVCFKPETITAGQRWVFFLDKNTGGGTRRLVLAYTGNSNTLLCTASNIGGFVIMQFTIEIPPFVLYRIQFTCDLSSMSNRLLIINGIDRTADVTWVTYDDDSISWNETLDLGVAGHSAAGVPAASFLGKIGELFITNEYMPTLSPSNNPFVDDENLCKYLGSDGSNPTGTQPPFYLPIETGKEGVNLGSEGDAVVDAGPWPGARGGSEYVGRSVSTNLGTVTNTYTNYLTRTGLIGGSAAQGDFTHFQQGYNKDPSMPGATAIFAVGDWATADNFLVCATSTENARMYINGSLVFQLTDSWIPANEWRTSFSHRNGTATRMEIEGAVATIAAGATFDLSTLTITIGSLPVAQSDWLDTTGVLYFIDSFLDTGDEAVQLLFIDAFGYVRDLTQAIIDGDLPDPLVYMKYENPNDLGINEGTGGDFTIAGTLFQGRDCLPEGST